MKKGDMLKVLDSVVAKLLSMRASLLDEQPGTAVLIDAITLEQAKAIAKRLTYVANEAGKSSEVVSTMGHMLHDSLREAYADLGIYTEWYCDESDDVYIEIACRDKAYLFRVLESGVVALDDSRGRDWYGR